MSLDSSISREPAPPGVVEVIPALRPQLPPADRLLPYLRRIDEARIYTNWGPLAGELEGRLGTHFGLGRESVISASSGTAALVGAILAAAGRGGPERPIALLPAFTFVATASAVEQCGYRPYLMDMDEESWLLDPGALTDHPILSRTGLVVPVVTFGRPVAQAPWHTFSSRTGVPVVIDGAASFEGLSADPQKFIGSVPVSLSFHATKTFATGEGGCVVTSDARLSTMVTRSLNFGFFENRDSVAASTNGKMSEYHAAVGLAELDGWTAKDLSFRTVATLYRERLDQTNLADRLVTTPVIAGCYVLFRCIDEREARRVQESLTVVGADFRLWYGCGLIGHSHFRDVPHDPLFVTERLAPLLIGLPVATDLSRAAVERIVVGLENGVRGR